MAETGLSKKLAIKTDNSVLLLHPPDGYEARLGTLPEGAHIVSVSQELPVDVVQVFVSSRDELEDRWAEAVEALKPGGVLWVSYPKVSTGQSDLSRDSLWQDLEPYGWRPVSQIALDDTWSALRFRPTADVKSKRAP